MKNHILIFILFVCSIGPIHSQSFETMGGDTINYTDAQNLKQGLWKSFYQNGNQKSEITYLNGEKYGYAKIYFENGNTAEEGTWLKDKWVGKYKSYYQNGKLFYSWNYNDYGNRSGYQQYFYENGNIKIEGDWEDGKENGIIYEYYISGSKRLQKNFSKGKCDLESIVNFEEEALSDSSETIKKDTTINENVQNELIAEEIANDTIEVFTGSGNYILFRKDKKPEKEGVFLNGILMNGKHYFYDSSGELIKTTLYKDGKIIKETTGTD